MTFVTGRGDFWVGVLPLDVECDFDCKVVLRVE